MHIKTQFPALKIEFQRRKIDSFADYVLAMAFCVVLVRLVLSDSREARI